MLKRVLFGFIALIALAFGALAFFHARGAFVVNQTHERTPSKIAFTETTSTARARGAHLSNILGCTYCHGPDLGGRDFLDVPPFHVFAGNLTQGKGGLTNYTDADWARAIRHGIRPNGKKMIVMPSVLFHALSDADLTAIVAHIKTQPPVDRELPSTELRAPFFVMAGAPGANPFPNVPEKTKTRIAQPSMAPTAEYGAYLARLSCVECHGPNLRGGPHPEPGAPPGPDLLPSSLWRFEDFKASLHTGKTPHKTQIRERFMPWRSTYAHLNDLEIKALHAHLKRLE